jgi:nicotinate phosphoribosyltransferase
VEAGKVFGIPVKGTHAHSWVMAFPSELESFRKFVEIFSKNSILLVDTYDTLKSGLPNAIKVGREMKERGERLLAVRIDSGDLAFLSIEARRLLDEAGLPETKIVASSELDEKIIHDLRIQGAKIDIYGVGTRLVTANGEPALSGVYKLSALKNEAGEWESKLKISDNIHKATLPGVKQVWRIYNGDGFMAGDIVDFENAEHDFHTGVWGFHPFIEYQKKFYDDIRQTEPLLTKVFSGGKITTALPKLPEIRERASGKLSALHPTMRRLRNAHVYKVSLGKTLMKETRRLRKR